MDIEKELRLLEATGQITINDTIQPIKAKKRGKKYTDIQCLFMVFLKGLGYSKKQLGVEFGTKWKTINNCINRGYELIEVNKYGNKGVKPLYSKRVRIITVGNTTDLELVASLQGKKTVLDC